MPVHKLILDDDFDDELYTLIAIHCDIDDYRLAYLLNSHLNISLSRKAADIDYSNEQVFYSIFEWMDNQELTVWNLVSNICKTEELQFSKETLLFENKEKIIRTFQLLPEHKTVNFFLKISSPVKLKEEQNIVNKILKIPLIATAYLIDCSQLKSKNNLIFN